MLKLQLGCEYSRLHDADAPVHAAEAVRARRQPACRAARRWRLRPQAATPAPLGTRWETLLPRSLLSERSAPLYMKLIITVNFKNIEYNVRYRSIFVPMTGALCSQWDRGLTCKFYYQSSYIKTLLRPLLLKQ